MSFVGRVVVWFTPEDEGLNPPQVMEDRDCSVWFEHLTEVLQLVKTFLLLLNPQKFTTHVPFIPF